MDASQSGICVNEYKITRDRRGQVEIKTERLEPEKFFYDPRSIKADFSDAQYMGSWGWFDIGTAEAMFPDKKDEMRESLERDFVSSEADAQQDWAANWFDTKRQLIKIIEMWIKVGDQWRFCFFTGSVKLASGESPFVDGDGDPACRFVAVSAYRDEQGDCYSIVRDLIPLQDEINQRRSKMLHMINTRQTWANSGIFKDVNKMRMEMSRPDGHIESEGVFGQDWGIIDQNDQISGQAALLEASKVEMESFGPGQALLGQGGLQDSSGRALALHLQAGMAKMQPFFNRIRDWKLRNYRMMWGNIQKYWTEERYILVTDDPNDIQHIPLNTIDLDDFGNPVPVNAVAEMDMDIIIDESPDTVTLQSETFDKIVQLVQAGIEFPPEILIEASDLDNRTKSRVLKQFEQAKQANPMAERSAMLEMAEREADIEKTNSETAKNIAASDKLQAETLETLAQPV